MKNIAAIIALLFVSMAATAQIDRSVQPKPGPAPVITLEQPGEFSLKNGLKVLVVENHKLPRVSYTLTIDNNPTVEGDIAGVSSLLGAMLGNGTTSIPKDEFNEEIDFLGATLNFGSSSAYGSSLTKYSERILELMADAAMNPLLTEEEFQKEKEKAIENLKSQAKSVDAVASRVGGALSYGKKHPYGEFITEETLNNITLDNVRAFYQKFFNPNNAYLVVVGDIDYKTVEKQVKKYFNKWNKGIEVTKTIPEPYKNVSTTEIDFIDMPNAVQSNLSVTSNVKLKMGDPDYHAVLIANKILGGGFGSYLNMNLREEHGYTYGARSSVGTDRYGASRFNATTAVRNAVTDSAVVESLKEIKRIKAEKVSAEDLKNAKAKYVGDFVLALERPQTIANYALNIKLNELPKDFYKTYLTKINAVTVEDVARVANKYFTEQNARVIIVGKGSEVISNLEKTGIPIKYFDEYANEVDKPVFSKAIPAGVTAQTVIDDYIKAIGGKEQAMSVKSTFTTASINGLAPFPLKAELKAMAPNKESMEMSAEGMGTLMKQKWNGTSGYMEQQGQRKDMSEKEIADKMDSHPIFPELYYDAKNVTLESIVTLEGVDTYKVKITKNGKDSFRYYNVASGLLIRSESKTEAQGQEMTTVAEFSNYTEVNGIKFPYSMKITAGPQTIPFEVSSVKINEGVTEVDFN
ncbi:pitrilysin family protein [Lacinutrix neustonica]|uniref:Pitrilysin family protein n=1 Tax=Lacinutrix neustonica TaxID=2980107 RepID=A0A9E8MUM7_9FLAO|nr:pitrilysin family protein [Lacinutrix neustonica]WAC01255.1 pitrilysin family protein [Lacinutrix neustonica]